MDDKPRVNLGMLGDVDETNSVTAAVTKSLMDRDPQPQPSAKLYNALISLPDAGVLRTSVLAETLDQAKELLEKEHGKGSVYSLHNKEDEDPIRGQM